MKTKPLDRLKVAAFAVAALGVSMLIAQAAGGPSAKALSASSAGQAAFPVNASLFKALQWRGIGPYRGGRALAVTGIAGDAYTFYFGAVAGGVWKTTDAGATWQSLTDHAPISSVGAIAIAPSNRNILYVGTGEAAPRGDITYGDGVYRTSDGGKTWTNVGLKDSRQIGALIVDPNNPDIVLVAALGHAFGPNAERGVFRTTDGGKTWAKVLYKDDQTGAIDVSFDPHNSKIVYAALWQARRQPWNFSSGGPGSGLYRSGDGGVTWTRLSGNGLPGGILGRIHVSVSGADSNRVYAMIEATQGGLFRSDDGGTHWRRINDDGRLSQRAWYFSTILADPKARGHDLCGEHRAFPLDRRRQDLRTSLRAARRSSRTVDRSDQSRPHHRFQRRRRHHQLRRRQELDHAEQSADGAVLSRCRRQSVSLLRLWRAAGQFEPRDRQPGRRGRDHRTGLVQRRRRRMRLRHRRSARSADHLFDIGELHRPLRPAHASGPCDLGLAHRRVRPRGEGAGAPLQLDLAARHVAVQSRHALFRHGAALQNHQ